jgi:hypothetical protein
LKKGLHNFKKITNDSIIFGIHIRIHQEHFLYVDTLQKTFEQVVSILDKIAKIKNMFFALASDSSLMITYLKNRYEKMVLLNNIERGPDRSFESALIDMAMLIGSNFFIGTQSSSYSYIIHARLNLKAFIITKYGKSQFLLENGESSYPSLLYFDLGRLQKTNFGVHICTTNKHIEILKKKFFIVSEYKKNY